VGVDLVLPGGPTPAQFDFLLLCYRGMVSRGIVRRVAEEVSGGWLVSLEWSGTVGRASVAVGARAERALFVTLDGYHVVARRLVAATKGQVSARLATGRMHTVSTNSVCTLSRSEREAELLSTDDFSFFVDFYHLRSVAGLGAVVEAILAIEFVTEEASA
jgi:hypothetical protein